MAAVGYHFPCLSGTLRYVRHHINVLSESLNKILPSFLQLPITARNSHNSIIHGERLKTIVLRSLQIDLSQTENGGKKPTLMGTGKLWAG